MLEKLSDLPPGIDGLKGVGRVSKDDYDNVLAPMLEDARRASRRLRFLYEFGPEFQGFTAGGAWEDAKIGLHSLRLFDGCAIVTDNAWIRESARLAAFMMPCPVRVFALRERERAIDWLRALPQGAALTHRLLADSGVIVVEIEKALRVQDFEALAMTADAWIESSGDLKGLVIHAREFPGWQNLDALFRHVRFVRDHHRRIRRIALSVDSALASLASSLGEPFIEAEVKRFDYESLDAAVAWASGRSASQASSTSAKTRA